MFEEGTHLCQLYRKPVPVLLENSPDKGVSFSLPRKSLLSFFILLSCMYLKPLNNFVRCANIHIKVNFLPKGKDSQKRRKKIKKIYTASKYGFVKPDRPHSSPCRTRAHRSKCRFTELRIIFTTTKQPYTIYV